MAQVSGYPDNGCHSSLAARLEWKPGTACRAENKAIDSQLHHGKHRVDFTPPDFNTLQLWLHVSAPKRPIDMK